MEIFVILPFLFTHHMVFILLPYQIIVNKIIAFPVFYEKTLKKTKNTI